MSATILNKDTLSIITVDNRIQERIGKYFEGNKEIFQKILWIKNEVPHDIDDIMDKVEDA